MPGQGPQITSSGHAVARSIELEDRIADMGAKMLREVASRTDDSAGDGATTAVVLAGTMTREGLKAVAAGLAPQGVGRGIERATEAALADSSDARGPFARSACSKPSAPYRPMATPGSASSWREPSMQSGKRASQWWRGIGPENRAGSTQRDAIRRRLSVATLVDDSACRRVEMEEPFVLVRNGEIASFGAHGAALRAFAKSGKWLLVIAHDVVGEALATLVLNRREANLKVAAVRAPGVGPLRDAVLEDIAIMTGAEPVGDGLGHTLEKLRPEMLGRAALAVVDDRTTSIIGGRGNTRETRRRCRELRAAIERQRYLSYDRERLQERLARLTGGVAEIRVGGDTDAEVRYCEQALAQALRAARAAVSDGIVPGGGVALLRCLADLAPLEGSSPDEAAGIEVVRRALTAPLRRIADNAGTEGATVVARVREHKTPDWGFDARRGRYANLTRSGVVDPVRVVRTALANAASAARLVIGTEAAIARHPNATPLASARSDE